MPDDDFQLSQRGDGRILRRGGADSGYTGVPGPDFGLDDGLMSVEDGSMASQLHLTRAHPEHIHYPDQVVIDGPVESIMLDEMNEVGAPAYEQPAPIIDRPQPAHHHQPPQTGITMEEAFNRHIQSQDQGATITHHPSTPRSTTQPTYLGQATPPGLNGQTLAQAGLSMPPSIPGYPHKYDNPALRAWREWFDSLTEEQRKEIEEELARRGESDGVSWPRLEWDDDFTPQDLMVPIDAVLFPMVRIERELPGEPGSEDRKSALKTDEILDEMVRRDGLPSIRDSDLCRPVCRILEQFWDNHPTNPNKRLNDAFNHKKGSGRKSWLTDWPGHPEWHVKADLRATERRPKWIYWKCEIDIVGNRLNEDRGMAHPPDLNIANEIRSNPEYRKAWEEWFASLLGVPADSESVKARVAGTWEPNRLSAFAYKEGVSELHRKGRDVMVVIDGFIPCRSGIYTFVIPIPPAPASREVDGTPTVHSTFYHCRFQLRAGRKCETNSGAKMRVVDHDDT